MIILGRILNKVLHVVIVFERHLVAFVVVPLLLLPVCNTALVFIVYVFWSTVRRLSFNQIHDDLLVLVMARIHLSGLVFIVWAYLDLLSFLRFEIFLRRGRKLDCWPGARATKD